MKAWVHMAKAMYLLPVIILQGHAGLAFGIILKIARSLLSNATLKIYMATTEKNCFMLCRNVNKKVLSAS